MPEPGRLIRQPEPQLALQQLAVQKAQVVDERILELRHAGPVERKVQVLDGMAGSPLQQFLSLILMPPVKPILPSTTMILRSVLRFKISNLQGSVSAGTRRQATPACLSTRGIGRQL